MTGGGSPPLDAIDGPSDPVPEKFSAPFDLCTLSPPVIFEGT